MPDCKVHLCLNHYYLALQLGLGSNLDLADLDFDNPINSIVLTIKNMERKWNMSLDRVYELFW